MKGLKAVDTAITFNLNDNYFGHLDATEVRKGSVVVNLDIHKTTDVFFEVDFHIEGEVVVQCDRCLDDMLQPVVAESHLVVKLGEEYSEEDDLITLDKNDGVLDVTWFIYEFIALNIPIKHVHTPGKCNSAMIKALEEHMTSATRSGDGDTEKPIDPRWSELKKLKTNN